MQEYQKNAQKVLSNKKLSSTIAKALAKNSHTSAREGIVLQVNGQSYTVKIASSSATRNGEQEAPQTH
jgi:hypothetical protein